MNLKYFLLFTIALAGQFSKGRELYAAPKNEPVKTNHEGSLLGDFSTIDYTDERDSDSSDIAETSDEGGIKEISASDESEPASEIEDKVTERAEHNPDAEELGMPAGTEADMIYIDDEGNVLREISKFPEDYEEIQDVSAMEAEVLTDAYTENRELEAANSQLEKQDEDLHKALDYQTQELDKIVQEDGETIERLKRDLHDMEAYNNHLQNVDTSEREDDDVDYEMEAHTNMVYVIGIGFLFLIMTGCRSFIGIKVDEVLDPALYDLFVNVAILSVLAVLSAIFDYFDVFEGSHLNMRLILLGNALFILIWFFCGMWLIVSAQSITRAWADMEDRCTDLESLEKEYAIVYQAYCNGDLSKRTLRREHKYIEYAMMRQEFICPTFLPPMAESFLRNDFDFGEYLSRCICDSLCQFFHFTWFSYLFVMLGVCMWRVVIYNGEMALYITFGAFPAVMILCLFLIIHKMNNIYYGLVAFSADPDEIHFPYEHFQQDPLNNIDKIKQPPYLEGKIPSREKTENLVNLCGKRSHPLEMSYAYMFEDRLPNRHEVMFWFDSAGPKFISNILQGFAVLLTLWVVVILLYYIGFFRDAIDYFTILTIGIAFILVGAILWYLIPDSLRLLTIVSNIGMMKNRQIISDTVISEKTHRSQNNIRIYRQLKLFRREAVQAMHPGAEQRERLDRNIEKLVMEAFKLNCEEGTDFLKLDRLEDALHMCGATLEEDEMRVFANECTDKRTKRIHLNQFLEAVECFTHDVGIAPQKLVKMVMRNYFKEKYPGINLEFVGLNDLSRFFDDHHRHLLQRDVIDFLHEAKYLTNKDKDLSVDEVASLIRDDVEMFPK